MYAVKATAPGQKHHSDLDLLSFSRLTHSVRSKLRLL